MTDNNTKKSDKTSKATVALLLFLFVAIFSSAQAQILILHEETSVKGNDLTLGQLLKQARGLEPKFLKMRIGSSPKIGETKKWTRTAIQTFLSKHYHGTIIWEGPGECIVNRPGRWIPEASVVTMIEKSLKRLTSEKGKVAVEELRNFQSFAVPKGDVGVVIDIPSKALENPWATAVLHFEESGKRVLSKNITFRWSWVRQVWRSLNNQKSRDLVHIENFKIEHVDVLKEPKDLVIDQFPFDHQLKQGLTTGRLLTQSQFRPRILIQQGDPVVVHYKTNGVRVTLTAIAMRDGSRNDVIPARNNKSRKLLSVRVIDERNVMYVN
ncbi:MAG: flagellar basal body P-ring formation chaperone FlgA [Verrucomicrobiota bacterium]